MKCTKVAKEYNEMHKDCYKGSKMKGWYMQKYELVHYNELQ